MTIVLQVVLGALVFLAYWWAAITLLRLPFVLGGMLVRAIRGPIDIGRLLRGRYLYVELLAPPFLAVALLVIVFVANAWGQDWLKIWEHPTLAGLLIVGAVASMRGSGAYFPAAREAAAFTFRFAWPLLALFIVIDFAGDQLKPETFKWSVTAMLSFVIVLTVFSALPVRAVIRRFTLLDERKDWVREKIARLTEISNILGETQGSQTVREALKNARELENAAATALRSNRLDAAEAAIIPAEMDIQYIDSLFSDRIRLSLPNEIQSRLRGAETDMERLRQELAQADVEEGGLAHLSQEIAKLLDEVSDKELSEDELVKRVEETNHILRQIQDTRTALRFRRNLESTISGIQEEVGSDRSLLATATAVGIDTASARRTLSELEAGLNEIKSGANVTSERLVEMYQAIQKRRAGFHGAMRSLEVEFSRGWQSRDAFEGAVTVYWPTMCSTGAPVDGAAVVHDDRVSDGKVLAARVEVGGTLLELPEPRIFNVAPADTDSYGLKSFSFAGKHGGMAKLTLDLEYVGRQEHIEGNVRVIPGLGESLAVAAGLGGVISAIAILALRTAIGDWGVSASVGAVIGGLAGPLLALSRLFWLRRDLAKLVRIPVERSDFSMSRRAGKSLG
jgi:hypothetical protein